MPKHTNGRAGLPPAPLAMPELQTPCESDSRSVDLDQGERTQPHPSQRRTSLLLLLLLSMDSPASPDSPTDSLVSAKGVVPVARAVTGGDEGALRDVVASARRENPSMGVKKLCALVKAGAPELSAFGAKEIRAQLRELKQHPPAAAATPSTTGDWRCGSCRRGGDHR
eukprot:COSAG06_NODE_3432_length_5355_cov_9.890982_4_plen_168_part_00